MTASCGLVYLVGGGPGDPGLITVRGLSLLHEADVIVHDRLAPVSLLDDLDESVEIIDVGKTPGSHRARQTEIDRLLVDRARRGLCVVRFKGGDPFVFGRGYEEMQACRAAGVPCVVVPGVSSAFAAPAVVGIPITSRKLVRTFAVLTASVAAESEVSEPDYTALAKIDTIVVLMGWKHLAHVTCSLIEAGRDGSTPVACIENATLPQQRVATATLETIVEVVARSGLRPPITTVIGQVAALADVPRAVADLGLDCRGASPMATKRVLVTRPAERSHRLLGLLRAKGAVPIACPLTEIVFPDENPPLEEAIRVFPQYDWIAFTSVNGVRGFWKGIRRMGLDVRAVGSCRVAAVDVATATALDTIGIVPDVVGAGRGAAGLAEQIISAVSDSEGDTAGRGPTRVLFPRSDRARPTLTEALSQAGMVVDSPITYRTAAIGASTSIVANSVSGCAAAPGGVDVILFYSPSSVEAFTEAGLTVGGAAVACIGETTASAARHAGINPVIICDQPSDEAMVEAISRHFHRAEIPA